jgi:flavodoxin I
MYALIVYDSLYGNTEQVARRIASSLSEFGQARAVRVGHIHPDELQNVDLLILGCPTQGMRQTPAMQAFIASIPRAILGDLVIACFDTRFKGGFWMLSAAPAMAKQFKTRGAELMVQPESFYVESMKREGPLIPGEIERAASWAHMLSEKMGARPIAMKA